MGVELNRKVGLQLWRSVTLEGVRAAEPDLTPRQMALLMTVYLSPEPHTVRGLASALNIAKPAVVRALDTLSEMGLVRRKRDEADKRNVLIIPTVKGAVFLTDLGERIERAADGLPIGGPAA